MIRIKSFPGMVLAGFLGFSLFLGTWWATGFAVLLVSSFRLECPRVSERRLRQASLLLTIVVAVWLGANFIASVQDFRFESRASGLEFHPNALASSALAVLVLIAIIADHAIPFRKSLLVLAVPATILFVSAASRSAMLGVAVGITLLSIVNLPVKTKPHQRLISIGVIFLAFAFAALPVYLRFGGLSNLQGTFQRLPLYSVALDLALISPLNGLGQAGWQENLVGFEPSFPDSHAPHPHSLLLRLLIEGGVTGTILVLAITFKAIRGFFELSSWRSSGLRSLAVISASGLAVQSFADTTLLQPSTYIPLLLAGLLSRYHRVWNNRAEEYPE